MKIFRIFFISFLLLVFNYALAKDLSAVDIKQQAIALYSTKNYKEAQSLLKNLPTDEKDDEVYILLSNCALENDNTNLAIQYLNKAIDKNPDCYKAYYNLGNIFIKKGSYILAANNYEIALKKNKSNAAIYYNLAYSQIKLKNYKQAKKNLIKSIELEPKNKEAYYNLALCYKKLNNEKQAKKVLEIYNNFS